MNAKKVFPTKYDRWLIAVLAASYGFGLAAVSVAVWQKPMEAAAAAVMFLAAILFTTWLLASTRYEIGGEELTIWSGPIRWRVPIKGIRSIQATRKPISSPAASLDRLRIEWERGKEKRTGVILVSPADKVGFLSALQEAGCQVEQ
jgi:membrane protein YdbS with pleckstrin-like domain